VARGYTESRIGRVVLIGGITDHYCIGYKTILEKRNTKQIKHLCRHSFCFTI